MERERAATGRWRAPPRGRWRRWKEGGRRRGGGGVRSWRPPPPPPSSGCDTIAPVAGPRGGRGRGDQGAQYLHGHRVLVCHHRIEGDLPPSDRGGARVGVETHRRPGLGTAPPLSGLGKRTATGSAPVFPCRRAESNHRRLANANRGGPAPARLAGSSSTA
jgi:hypothetical protein